MSQASEDTRAYSSWNRTPGKPNNSTNYLNTKMSNISSSTDSGVGRTPNWNSDTDCKFSLMETNLWSNNNVIQSPDNIDPSKKLPWEDNSTKMTGNTTFGFTSQWSINNDIPLSSNHNPTWGLPQTSPGDYLLNEPGKIDNCWNSPPCQTDENYMPHSSSIWSSGTQRPYTEHSSDLNTTCSSTNDFNSNSQNFKSMDTPKITLPTTEKCDMTPMGAFNNEDAGEKGSEPQTWAQAAGKGLRTSISSDDEGTGPKRELDEEYQTIINRVDGWGSHTVDQSTPWITSESDLTAQNTCASEKLTTLARRSCSATESNVWTNEPPNGVGVWESHYEHIGEKTSRWNNASACVKPKTGWDLPEAIVGGQWGERDNDSCVWNAATSLGTEPGVKSTWMGSLPPGPKQEQQNIVAPIGSGSRAATQVQNFPIQRNSNALVPGISNSISSDLSESIGRQSFYQQNQMMTNINRPNPNLKIRPMMNLGFRKEDAQGALYNNGMDINRAMNQSSVNPSSIMTQRNDWNMVPDNFRNNTGDIDMMGSANYMQSQQQQQQQQQQAHSMVGGNASSMKQQQQMQHMQHMQKMAMNQQQRMASDNQPVFEKQIINEINQLQTKHKELVHRIACLRSIAGSQAIIQEMTRTLNEVTQQLSTQQATLKVIRNQMPNGVMGMNNGTGLSSMVTRAMPPQGQGLTPQSANAISDLSLHMNDMKIQKRNMELWSQGQLPSPNTISPYMGMDKSSGMFYNVGNQMNGPPMSQSFNYKSSQQSNYLPQQPPLPGQHHRQQQQQQQHQQQQSSGQMWPPRVMGPGSGAQQGTGNSGDCHPSLMNTASSEDGDNSMNNSMPGGGGYGSGQVTGTGESRNINNNSATNTNTTTTALSLSQALSARTSAVSSAFTTRDISFASANISEFVPGQPWPGISYSQRDDPNITLGTGQRSLLSVTNDHLEKLANSNVNSLITSNDVGANSNMNRLPSGVNGGTSGASMTYVLIRDLPSHINIEMLRNVLNSQNFPGLIQMHPNLAARWVLLHFTSNDETLKAFKNLNGKVGVVELVPDQEVSQRMQYSNCNTVGPVIPCSGGVMDFHQQSQSHYLH